MSYVSKKPSKKERKNELIKNAQPGRKIERKIDVVACHFFFPSRTEYL
jgi:hypothetical protein